MVSVPTFIPRVVTNDQSLKGLAHGQKGVITHIEGEEIQLALLELGIKTGDEMTHMGTAPLGDPISIMVNRTQICIRKRDAENIWITVK